MPSIATLLRSLYSTNRSAAEALKAMYAAPNALLSDGLGGSMPHWMEVRRSLSQL